MSETKLPRSSRLPRIQSRIGLGGGPLGDAERVSDDSATRLVHAAIDLGVDVIDTAPSYGASEERLGRALAETSAAGRFRDRVVLVTKGGYGVAGVQDWSRDVITAGIEQALRRLQTDRIDVFLLHSCSLELLTRGDLLEALDDARRAGKIRAFGYSGDGTPLAWASRCDAVDVIECSLNIVDREALAESIPRAIGRGAVVLAKRAYASGAFVSGFGREGPDGIYPSRFRALAECLIASSSANAAEIATGLTWPEIAVRFAAHGGADTALVGTSSVEHLAFAVLSAARGALPEDVSTALTTAWNTVGATWSGVV
jgi:aryl-alcohol dehydrogenase-like predicted oxidoreductase